MVSAVMERQEFKRSHLGTSKINWPWKKWQEVEDGCGSCGSWGCCMDWLGDSRSPTEIMLVKHVICSGINYLPWEFVKHKYKCWNRWKFYVSLEYFLIFCKCFGAKIQNTFEHTTLVIALDIHLYSIFGASMLGWTPQRLGNPPLDGMKFGCQGLEDQRKRLCRH